MVEESQEVMEGWERIWMGDAEGGSWKREAAEKEKEEEEARRKAEDKYVVGSWVGDGGAAEAMADRAECGDEGEAGVRLSTMEAEMCESQPEVPNVAKKERRLSSLSQRQFSRI